MTAARLVYEVIVEACPEDQQNTPKSEREIRKFSVLYAGPMHSIAMSVEKGLWAHRLCYMRTISMDRIRKAKGREGPGIISIEPLVE